MRGCIRSHRVCPIYFRVDKSVLRLVNLFNLFRYFSNVHLFQTLSKGFIKVLLCEGKRRGRSSMCHHTKAVISCLDCFSDAASKNRITVKQLNDKNNLPSWASHLSYHICVLTTKIDTVLK